MVSYRIPAEYEGEEIVIHNTLSFAIPRQFKPGIVETFEPQQVMSVEGESVEYVTERLAMQLWKEEMIDVEEKFGFEVVDPESDEVELI